MSKNCKLNEKRQVINLRANGSAQDCSPMKCPKRSFGVGCESPNAPCSMCSQLIQPLVPCLLSGNASFGDHLQGSVDDLLGKLFCRRLSGGGNAKSSLTRSTALRPDVRMAEMQQISFSLGIFRCTSPKHGALQLNEITPRLPFCGESQIALLHLPDVFGTFMPTNGELFRQPRMFIACPFMDTVHRQCQIG